MVKDLFRSTYFRVNGVIDQYQRAEMSNLLKLALVKESAQVPTVYILAPDYNTPSGGMLVIYRHVDLLNSAGIRAYVLHRRRGFRCTWFNHKTQVTDLSEVRIKRGDLLVFSELDIDLAHRLPHGTRHVIFNQNGYLTWTRNADEVNRHHFTSPDLAGIITVSDYSEELLHHAFPNVLVRRIHLSLDSNLFYLAEGPRDRRIAYMPRRGRADAEIVLNLVKGRGVLEDWEIMVLDGLKQAEIAEQLRMTRIFLAFSYEEGFGLPAFEAMACGNYVIGYHGFGGREFFHPEFSAPIDAGDVLAFVRALENAIAHESSDPTWCSDRGRMASRFILSNYSPDRECHDVINAYMDLM